MKTQQKSFFCDLLFSTKSKVMSNIEIKVELIVAMLGEKFSLF